MALKGIWRGIGHAGSAQFLLQSLQWIISVGVGVVIGLTARVAGEPLWVILLAGLGGLAAALLIIRLSLPLFARVGQWNAERRAKLLPRRTLLISTEDCRLPLKVRDATRFESHRLIWAEDRVMVGRFRGPVGEDGALDWGPEGPARGLRMEVTNRSPDTLLDVKITFDARAREFVRTESGSRSGDLIWSGEVSVQLDKVPSGEDRALTCYIGNEMQHYASLDFKSATGRVLGSTEPIDLVIDASQFSRMMWLHPREERA